MIYKYYRNPTWSWDEIRQDIGALYSGGTPSSPSVDLSISKFILEDYLDAPNWTIEQNDATATILSRVHSVYPTQTCYMSLTIVGTTTLYMYMSDDLALTVKGGDREGFVGPPVPLYIFNLWGATGVSQREDYCLISEQTACGTFYNETNSFMFGQTSSYNEALFRINFTDPLTGNFYTTSSTKHQTYYEPTYAGPAADNSGLSPVLNRDGETRAYLNPLQGGGVTGNQKKNCVPYFVHKDLMRFYESSSRPLFSIRLTTEEGKVYSNICSKFMARVL